MLPQKNEILHSLFQILFSLVLFFGFNFIFERVLNFFEDHISTINYFSCYRNPKFVTFYSIFVTNKDTFLCFIFQLSPFLLWNMHERITPKNSKMCNRRLLTRPYLRRSFVDRTRPYTF